jgi:hypothetical protein
VIAEVYEMWSCGTPSARMRRKIANAVVNALARVHALHESS